MIEKLPPRVRRRVVRRLFLVQEAARVAAPMKRVGTHPVTGKPVLSEAHRRQVLQAVVHAHRPSPTDRHFLWAYMARGEL